MSEIDDDLEAVDDAATAVTAHGVQLKGVIFIIPLGSPLPPDVNDAPVAKGTLYERLLWLTQSEQPDEFRFVPLAGAELHSLDRIWRTFVAAPRVHNLSGLPAVQYDVLYTQATRQLGIPELDWPSVTDAMTQLVRTKQHRGDTQPWLEQERFLPGKTTNVRQHIKKPSRHSQRSNAAPGDDEQDETMVKEATTKVDQSQPPPYGVEEDD